MLLSVYPYRKEKPHFGFLTYAFLRCIVKSVDFCHGMSQDFIRN